MRKLFLILILLFAPSCYVWSATEQVIPGGADDNLTTSSGLSEYIELQGSVGGASSWTTTEANVEALIPAAGTIDLLYVEVTAAPGPSSSGDARDFTVRKNGADTSLTCQIFETETTCATTTETATFAAGDEVSFEMTNTNVTASAEALWSVRWLPDTAKYTIFSGNSDASNLSDGNFYPINGSFLGSTTTEHSRIYMPTSGTIRSLYFEISADPTSTHSRTLTVHSGSTLATASSVTCTISAGSTTCNDPTNTLAVSAGDFLGLKHTVSGSPASATGMWGVVFETTTDGEFVWTSTSNDNISTTSTEYLGFNTGDEAYDTAESDVVGMVTKAVEIKAIYATAENTPGATEDWTLTLREDGASSSEITCTIDSVDSECSDTGTDTLDQYDEFTVQSVPTNTPPLSSNINVSLLGFIDPGTSNIRRVIRVF